MPPGLSWGVMENPQRLPCFSLSPVGRVPGEGFLPYRSDGNPLTRPLRGRPPPTGRGEEKNQNAALYFASAALRSSIALSVSMPVLAALRAQLSCKEAVDLRHSASCSLVIA